VTERVLTARELNRALLERQLLLRRHKLNVARALERIAGLQAQWTNSPYIALWSRLDDFDREQLTRALKRRAIVKATLMRMTLHMVSARDYFAFAGVFRDDRMERFARELAKHRGWDPRTTAERAIAAIGDRPATRAEYFEAAGEDPSPRTGDMRRWIFWSGLQTHGQLVHVPPSGTWGYWGSAIYAPAHAWLGTVPPVDGDPRVHLIRRYLAAFGPASTADLNSWSGATALRPALTELEPELRTFRDEGGRRLYDVRRAPLPDPETAAPVRFLPKWDTSILGHAPPERWRILPERFRRRVIGKNGDVAQTVLVDGLVAAIWNVEKGKLKLDPLRRLTVEERAAVDDEGERLLEFLVD
jgi:hypothetical protein